MLERIVEHMRWFGCPAGGEVDAAVELKKGYAGRGWYVWCSEYPEDGSVFLGRDSASLREEIATARAIVECEARQMFESYAGARDLLAVIGFRLHESTFQTWTDDARRQVERWASMLHLKASDNAVYVPKKPAAMDFVCRLQPGEVVE